MNPFRLFKSLSLSRLEISALLFSFIVGFLFIFLIPPFQKTDETGHFYKTIAVAQGKFSCATDANGNPASPIPQYLESFPQDMKTEYVDRNLFARFPKSTYIMFLKQQNFDTSMTTETVSCALPFLFYMPAALVLALPVAFKANPLIIFYLGRVSFFIFTWIIFYISLRIIPKQYRSILLFIMTLPMVLIQSASFNKEVYQIALGMLSFSLLMALRDGTIRHTWKTISIFIASLLLFILPRPQYAPFILIALLAFQKQVQHYIKIAIKHKFITGIVVLLGIISFYGITQLYIPTLNRFHALPDHGEGVYGTLQLQYVLQQPTRFLEALFNSYIHHMDAYWKSYVGVYGWIHYYLDWYVYAFYGLLLFGLILSLRKVFSTTTFGEYLILISSIVLSTIGMTLSLYLYATPVGLDNIIDVQGRYFIMMTPYIVWLAAALIAKFKDKLLYVGFALVFLSMVRNVYMRYYDYSKFYDKAPISHDSSWKEMTIDKEITQKISVEPGKKLAALAIYVPPKDAAKYTTKPYVLTIMDESCSKKLREEIIVTRNISGDSLNDITFKPLELEQSTICISIKPFEKSKQLKYMYLYGDEKDNVIVVPRYLF